MVILFATLSSVMGHRLATEYGSAQQAISSETDGAGSLYTFSGYKEAYARSYEDDSKEHVMRKQIFDRRVAQIRMHNSQPHSWKLGINHLTDRTDEELRAYRGYKRSFPSSSQESLLATENFGSSCLAQQQACDGSKPGCCTGLVCGSKGLCEESPSELPKHIDWTPKIPTSTLILDQGACGSCWAIAATAAIQMQAVLNSNLTFQKVLSPQGMLGCTPNPNECGGKGGCEGATPELGYDWAKKNGLHLIDRQSYKAQSGCAKSFLEAKPIVKIGGYVRLPENKATNLMTALVTSGPVAVAVAAHDWSMYSSGVFDGCQNWIIDHAVLLVGYGKGEAKAYWKIRNSWGTEWGEGGFIRLVRHAPHGKEPCGWDTDPQKGVGCKGGPSKLWVCGACGVLSDSAYPVGSTVQIGPL